MIGRFFQDFKIALKKTQMRAIIQGFADHGEVKESEAKAERKGSLKTYSR